MQIQVSVQDWLAVPMPVRIKLREIFGIPKSQGSLVEGGIVKSDGTTYEDLKAITVEKMQAYLGAGSPTDDFVILFHATIEKIEEQDKELEPAEKIDPNQIILEEWASRISHMIHQAGNLGLTDALKVLISKLLPYDNARKEPDSKKSGRPAKKAK